MKVHLDTSVCSGHGRCYMLASEVFEDDGEGFGRVIGHGELTREFEEQARTGRDNCPERAITLQ